MSIEALEVCWWSAVSGGTYAGSCGGMSGQLTKCRMGNVIFYVRENIGGIDRFNTSSAQRLGMKKGQMPKYSYQVLDLCAPKEHWDTIAAAIMEEDKKGGMERPVRHHQNFTVDWAEHVLKQDGSL